MVATVTRKIVLSGYYGFRNSGDEAVLRSILTALEEEGTKAGISFEPIVLSADPEWTTKMYNVRAVPRMKLAEVRKAIQESDGLISGGGSLLQDATGPASVPYYLGVIKLAQWLGKPTFVYAQGVGPVGRKLFHRLIASVFKKCRYLSVRDIESAELLRTMGLKKERVEVVPDPVMGMKLPEEKSRWELPGAEPLTAETINAEPSADELVRAGMGDMGDQLPIIGISVRFWNKERTELSALAAGLAELARQRRVHLRFLPFHLPSDEEASRFCMNQIGSLDGTGSLVSMAPATDNPQDMLREVDGCSLLIGMRLHSLIYAASRSVPLMGISYDPKIDQFLARLGIVAVGTSDQLSADKVSAKALHYLSSREDWQKRHSGQIEQLKQEAMIPAQRITDYFLKDKG